MSTLNYPSYFLCCHILFLCSSHSHPLLVVFFARPTTQSNSSDVKSDRDAAVLYPNMLESPQRRGAFIRKVYAIISVQLLLTAGVASTVFLVKPVSRFVAETHLGLAVYIALLVLSFILIFPLCAYRKRHPVNFVLLGLFTVTNAFNLGLSCAFTKGKIILEAAILMSSVVVALTSYTFWAVKRGHDFSFLGPFLFASLLAIIVFAVIQIFFPLGKLSTMIFGCLGSIIFAAFIVYDTNILIKHFSYDEYIWAALSIYLDIINLFLNLLDIFEAADSLEKPFGMPLPLICVNGDFVLFE